MTVLPPQSATMCGVRQRVRESRRRNSQTHGCSRRTPRRNQPATTAWRLGGPGMIGNRCEVFGSGSLRTERARFPGWQTADRRRLFPPLKRIAGARCDVFADLSTERNVPNRGQMRTIIVHRPRLTQRDAQAQHSDRKSCTLHSRAISHKTPGLYDGPNPPSANHRAIVHAVLMSIPHRAAAQSRRSLRPRNLAGTTLAASSPTAHRPASFRDGKAQKPPRWLHSVPAHFDVNVCRTLIALSVSISTVFGHPDPRKIPLTVAGDVTVVTMANCP